MLFVIQVSKVLMTVYLNGTNVRARPTRWYRLLISSWLLLMIRNCPVYTFSIQLRTSDLSITCCALSQAFYLYSPFLCSSLHTLKLPTRVLCNRNVTRTSEVTQLKNKDVENGPYMKPS